VVSSSSGEEGGNGGGGARVLSAPVTIEWGDVGRVVKVFFVSEAHWPLMEAFSKNIYSLRM
jgi:hypothetical protein